MTTNLPAVFTPMLATSAAAPFDSPDYWFEIKWDGVRVLAFCERGRTRLYSRTHREVTHQYPEFDDLHDRLSVPNTVIDGEIFTTDESGRPSFELLQQRIGLTRPSDVRRAVSEWPVQLACFDLPWVEGEWLSDTPLSERFERLGKVCEFGGGVLRPDPILEHGIATFEAAKQRGLEGIVAKQTESRYYPGKRTKSWMKIKVVNQIDCVIGGWSPGQGSRAESFGSLLLGLFDGDDLRYIGSVGTGFTEKKLAELMKEMRRLETDQSPFAQPPKIRGARWVKPELVCEVDYREITAGYKLRAPAFKGLRTDKAPEDCRIEN